MRVWNCSVSLQGGYAAYRYAQPAGTAAAAYSDRYDIFSSTSESSSYPVSYFIWYAHMKKNIFIQFYGALWKTKHSPCFFFYGLPLSLFYNIACKPRSLKVLQSKHQMVQGLDLDWLLAHNFQDFLKSHIPCLLFDANSALCMQWECLSQDRVPSPGVELLARNVATVIHSKSLQAIINPASLINIRHDVRSCGLVMC